MDNKKKQQQEEEEDLVVTLRPKSARSRFIFANPVRPTNSKSQRAPQPPPSPRRQVQVTISSLLSKEENEKMDAARSYNKECNVIMDMDTTTLDVRRGDEIKKQKRTKFVNMNTRPVRLWKWNHVEGATGMADFKTYQPRSINNNHSNNDRKDEEDTKEEKEDGDTETTMTTTTTTTTTPQDRATVSFFTIIRIHEAECPLECATPVWELLTDEHGESGHPQLPNLAHPPHDTMPPTARRNAVLATPHPSTNYVPNFLPVLSLTAKETAHTKVRPFTLRSLVFATMLIPKFPMTKTFKARKLISDSNGLTESKDMYKKAFEADWSRLSRKKDFMKNVMRIKNEHDFEWVKRSIIHHYRLIFSCYSYYACIGGGDSFTMSEQELRLCLKDVKMLKPLKEKTKTTTSTAATSTSTSTEEEQKNEALHNKVGLIFVQTNIEERVDPAKLHAHKSRLTADETTHTAMKQEQHNCLNPDRGLMRFEFMEALLRLASWYFEIKSGTELPDAFNQMFEIFFVPNLPARSIIRHDVWRIKRLYTEELDKVILKHKWLRHTFKEYCDYTYEFESKSKKKHFKKRTPSVFAAAETKHDDEEEKKTKATDVNEGLGEETVPDESDKASVVSASSKKSKGSKKKSHHHGKNKKKKKKLTFVSELMPLGGWLKFLSNYGFIKTGLISLRDATLIFVYSKMGIVEEIDYRFLFTHMDICSFYEGLARVAEYCRVSTMSQLSSATTNNPKHTHHSKLTTAQKYFDMDNLEPSEIMLRIKRIYKPPAHSGMDQMAPFGAEFNFSYEAEKLSSKLKVMLAHIQMLDSSRHML